MNPLLGLVLGISIFSAICIFGAIEWKWRCAKKRLDTTWEKATEGIDVDAPITPEVAELIIQRLMALATPEQLKAIDEATAEFEAKKLNPVT